MTPSWRKHQLLDFHEKKSIFYLAKNYSEMFTASKTGEKLTHKEKLSMMTNFDGMKAVRPRDSIPRDESLDTFQGFLLDLP